ncbi:MAG: DUF1553 domain-containing protein [Verrucomicrobia bacterium]|nr:DUF1553 domain-containing protein [Verrucomicrobiota bacterium]
MQSNSAKSCEAAAAECGLDPGRLARWGDALNKAAASPASHPMFRWCQFARHRRLPSRQMPDTGPATGQASQVFTLFPTGALHDWFLDGPAFEPDPSPAGEWVVGDTNQPVLAILSEPAAHSGTISRRLQGALRSPTFVITNRFLHLLVAGRDSRINLFVDNFALIQSPIYGSLRHVLDHDQFRWLTLDIGMWLGHQAYLEFSDLSTPDLAGGGKTGGYGLQGYVAVSQALFSDVNSPPTKEPDSTVEALLNESDLGSMEALARAYQRAAIQAVAAWGSHELPNSIKGRARLMLLDWLVQNRLLGLGNSESPLATPERIQRLLGEFQKAESAIPDHERVPAMADGTGLDERLFIRGNPRTLGDVVPRRFLQAFGGAEQTCFKQGSGRLELARCLVDSSNPYLARVMVNRVWHHLFGRGLVETPDDFGVLGQPPTHPELLDWLAGWFRDEARWSTKKLIRLLVTSSAYRMSSQSSGPLAEEKDPDNSLLHRMPVRRLEGEVIRDALLAVSGRLDCTLFGPPVPIHLNDFMQGRGRPAESGPLDGGGRRSIYVEVRRNFLAPTMRTFDAPVPLTTVGRRTVSNVPAQSLILMNDPFVVGQARGWARRLLKEGFHAKFGSQWNHDPTPRPLSASGATHHSAEDSSRRGRGAGVDPFMARTWSPEALVQEIFLRAFGRSASETELAQALEFVRRQAEVYRNGQTLPPAEEIWADLCHVIFNAKEFIFIE